ncbi:uroporphyrinogen decarboxylase family protein [uncultured Bacteroides sp.]|uniref:uroporphyrinogen decarboxylase family protein n=1 Tax=uncultured Bacteroides sp. TaxID=162156 RepID=UPI0025FFD569|nr:uroporphyrinogen decarboxylase family protein [uncultured Bacteroides sp.]
MKDRNMNQWVDSVLSDKKRIAIPIMTHPGIELIGKTVYEAVSDGQVHFEAIKALNDKYPSAACSVIMDLTVEAEAFGAKVDFPKDEIPNVIGRLVADYEGVEKMEIPDMSKGRLREYLKANRLTAEAITDKPVFGGMIGPFSLAGRLFDMSEFMMACYCEPDTANLLLEKCTEFLTIYCLELKNQGIQGVVIAEPAAGLMSNDGCDEFSSLYVKKIVDAVQDDNFVVILHNCGNTGHCTEAMVATGARAFHFGNKIDMKNALNDCPADVLVMGNLDPVTLFKSATPEVLKEATLELLHKAEGYPNFVLSSGCDVPPHTPHTNIEAFYAALEAYNQSV